MEPNKIPSTVFDPASENLQRLSALFPSIIKDGLVDFEALKAELGIFEEVGDECYELTWAGKQEAKKVAAEGVSGRTLKYVPEDSKNPETTENLYIEGDNLEVLKLLQNSYMGRIKMIYIDPPYNTGKDFIYKDKFSVSEIENAKAEGDVSKEGKRYVVNTKSSGKYHAKWLSMMYPRLRLAKNLLRDDGVIFVSIDDNEVHNLREMMDEIFGKENYVAEFIWKSKLGKVGTTSTISITHEYIITYAKNFENLKFKIIEKKSDGRKENLRQWGQADRREDRPSMFYPIIIDGQEIYPIKQDGSEGRWRVGKEKAEELLNNDFLELVNKDGLLNIYRIFPEGISRTPYDTLLLDEIGTTAKGSLTLKEIGLQQFFNYPKSIELLNFFISLCSNKKDIILDFFSGSATTAHATMKLNAEDGDNRRFIMVQLPEKCDEKSEAYRAGFKNIAEIGKERIRRAGEKILKESGKGIDTGFKVFKTADTNIRWIAEENGIQISQTQLNNITKPVIDLRDFMPDATDIDVAYEILLRQYDIPLSANMETLTDIGNRTYCFADTVVVCLEEELTGDIIDKIAAIEPMPHKVVFRDSAFGKDIGLKINTMERFDAMMKKHSDKTKQPYTVEFL